MSVKLIFPAKPDWNPLELIIELQNQRNDFQFMGLVIGNSTDSNNHIAIYRHRASKRYINIDKHGKTYVYNGTTYDLIEQKKAINHVLIS